MQSIDDVRAAFHAGRQKISTLDQELAEKREAIRRNAFHNGRTLTREELTRLKKIGATRTALADAMESLALRTLCDLDNATNLDKAIALLKLVNQEISDDLAQLSSGIGNAKNADDMVKAISRTIDKLVSFRDSV